MNGDCQFTAECDSKIEQWIAIRDVISVDVVGRDVLPSTMEEVEWSHLVMVQVDAECLYFAPHPNSLRNAQKWAGYILSWWNWSD